MENIKSRLLKLKEKQAKVLVLGAGKTGISTARFFNKLGCNVEIWDEAGKEDFLRRKKNKEISTFLDSNNTRILFNNEYLSNEEIFDLCLPSPGISPKSQIYKKALTNSRLVSSEFETGCSILKEIFGAKVIFVTGSNGKSTTVSLLDFVLKSLGKKSELCGNIGKPVIDVVPENLSSGKTFNEDLIIVAEASSYQLEALTDYKPDIAVMLNLVENHLERHGNMDSYCQAKRTMCLGAESSQILVINNDFEYKRKFSENLKSRTFTFGSDKQSDLVINTEKQEIDINRVDQKVVFRQADCQLPGKHNLYNIAAVLSVCLALNLDIKLVIEAVNKFNGLEHRLEKIQIDATRFAINDSKATTVDATLAACRAILESSRGRKIILMIGGQEKKGSDWSVIKKFIQDNNTAFSEVVTFGECGDRLRDYFCNLQSFAKLEAAIDYVISKLDSSNLALFSPGCASFDEFEDFEERGNFFVERVLQKR